MSAPARGFTLVEAMTTVAVLGLMTSMSLYGFDQMTQGSKQAAAVKDVYVLMQEARSEARARNQPVRLEVLTQTASGVTTQQVRWDRLPCADSWGRTCPDAACLVAPACGVGGCVCEARSEAVSVPLSVTMTNLSGLCLLGSSAQPRGTTCSGPPVTEIRFDLASASAPWLIVLEPLNGNPRLIDCARKPKDPSCP